MLAELSGIPLGTLAKILARSETKDPQISSIIKIAKALDVSCDYLIYGIDTAIPTQNSMSLSAVELKMIENFRTLNEEGQEKASEYLQDLVHTGRYKKMGQFFMASKEA